MRVAHCRRISISCSVAVELTVHPGDPCHPIGELLELEAEAHVLGGELPDLPRTIGQKPVGLACTMRRVEHTELGCKTKL
jgi:hypothetical protein